MLLLKRLIAVFLSAVFTTGTPGWTDVLYSPVSVATDLGEYPVPPAAGPTNLFEGYWKMTNMINQSGLRLPFRSGNVGTNFFLRPNWKVSTNRPPVVWSSLPLEERPLPGVIDFDFGTDLRFVQIIVWNSSAKRVSLSLKGEASSHFTEIGEFELTFNSLRISDHAPDFIVLDEPLAARHLRFVIESVYPQSVDGMADTVIIGEVMVGAEGEIQPQVSISLDENDSVWVRWTGIPQWSDNVDGPFADAFIGVGGQSGPWYHLDSYELLPWRQAPRFFRAE